MAFRQVVAFALPLLLAASAGAQERPYDLMRRSFGVYLDPTDDNAWPDKVRAIARDEYHFWRGTRDVFYAWAATHCRDWTSDRSRYVVSHGDLHLGNTGSYAARPFGTLAYGPVDFDESARLPVELELLQGLVTFELVARENKIDLSDDNRTALQDAVFDGYAAALRDPPADNGLRALLKDRTARPYAEEIEKFTKDGRFRREVAKNGVVTDRLRPLDPSTRGRLAEALAEAVRHDARLAALLRPFDAADFDAAIRDAVRRTRVDSSGSQGLSKLLVLLKNPFRDRDGDGLLYLKEEIPAAAERAGLVPPVDGSPARRYVRDMDALTAGQSLASSWCDFDGRAYWVSVKEPWSDEPDFRAVRDLPALLAAARVWGGVFGGAHGGSTLPLPPAVRELLLKRAEDYLEFERDAYADFRNDARVKAIIGH